LQRKGFPFQLDRPANRGVVLSIVLILYIAFCVIGAANLAITLALWEQISPQFAQEAPGIPVDSIRQAMGVALAAYLLGGAGAFGIWKWRRWGMYMIVVGAIAASILELAMGMAVAYSPFHVSALVVITVLIWEKWRHME
jgi:hypothetical protein